MVYLLLAEGFETIEAMAPLDVLRRGGVPVQTAGVAGLKVTGAQGVCVCADIALEDIRKEDMDMLILPGGPGVQHLKENETVLDLVKYAYERDILIGAICAAPTILAELGLLSGRRAVCFPGCASVLEEHGAKLQTDVFVTHDRNLITAAAAGSCIDFGLKLLAMLRGWTAAETIRREIYYQDHVRALT